MVLTQDLDWNMPKIIVSFVKGNVAKTLWDTTDRVRTGEMGYDETNREVYGSTPFLSARIDTEVRRLLPGFRVATFKDLCSSEIREMIKDKYYSDAPALIAKSEQDPDFPINNPSLEILMNLASAKHEKLPFIVTGFNVVPWEDDAKGYKIKIVPRADFKIIHDDRLSNSGVIKFRDVDAIGLPVPDYLGYREWYLEKRGLFGVSLNRNLYLGSYSKDFGNSHCSGRVVIVSGEATQKNL